MVVFTTMRNKSKVNKEKNVEYGAPGHSQEKASYYFLTFDVKLLAVAYDDFPRKFILSEIQESQFLRFFFGITYKL